MNRKSIPSLRRVLGDESGAALILAAVSIFALVGFGALSVDVGYLFAAQRALQASADAAAIAGARDIGVGGTPVATATSYSSVTASPANKNNDPSLTVTWASGYPLLKCFGNIGGGCSTNQTPATSANGIEVRQLATVPLFFGRIFGISSVNISANAVALAAGGVPHPLNVMFIVDTTGSMNGTPITNALAGFRTLLGQLWPCPSNLPNCGTATNGNVANPVDEAALMVFPPLDGPPASPVPPATDPSQAPYEYDCSTNPLVNIAPAYAGRSGTTSAATAAGNSTLHFTTTPTFNSGTTAFVTDTTHPSAIPAGTYITQVTGTTAVMSANATGTGIASGDTILVKPLYEIVPLSSDYRTSDTSGLNTASNLVKAARGGAAGCTQGLDDRGGLGTYYADAITAAQTVLAANARTGATNVIVLLSDGDASGAGTSNGCHLAITAAQNAAKAGTWVYSIAFNSPNSGCNLDSPSISACSTMSQIANMPGATAGTYFNDLTKFYSDNASGCTSTRNPSITSINSIFQSIGNSLSTSRLLPNNCFGASPPAWCS
jgi:Putative Flp pilus-assembly TadE/G-like